MKNLQNALTLKQLYQLKQIGYKYNDLYQCRVTNNSKPKIVQNIVNDIIEDIQPIENNIENILNCSLCQLSNTRSRVVAGGGDYNADVMFISDTPTYLQANSDNLFVGRSSEMLINMVQKVLLVPISKIYFTHIVKCRPPNGDLATTTQAHSCLPYLHKEIELVKPKVVVTIGTEAYKYLTGDNKKIVDVRGTQIKKDGYTIIPIFHIKYLLRNPSAKKYTFEDMKLVKSLIS
jgi:DNA polymerase